MYYFTYSHTYVHSYPTGFAPSPTTDTDLIHEIRLTCPHCPPPLPLVKSYFNGKVTHLLGPLEAALSRSMVTPSTGT